MKAREGNPSLYVIIYKTILAYNSVKSQDGISTTN